MDSCLKHIISTDIPCYFAYIIGLANLLQIILYCCKPYRKNTVQGTETILLYVSLNIDHTEKYYEYNLETSGSQTFFICGTLQNIYKFSGALPCIKLKIY
jgi:hypothetical protein